MWNRFARLGLAAQAGLLLGIVGMTALAMAPLAYAISGMLGVVAAAAAAGTCLLGGEMALALGGLMAKRVDALYAVLVGMLSRMAIPLALGAGLHLVAPWLTRAGLFLYFMVFYAVILAVETAAAVAHVSQDSAAKKAT